MNFVRVGDRVWLKCGGPTMVVTSTNTSSIGNTPDKVTCVWYNLNFEMQRETFPVVCLYTESEKDRLELLQHEATGNTN